VKLFADWHNEHRPHTAIDGMTHRSRFLKLVHNNKLRDFCCVKAWVRDTRGIFYEYEYEYEYEY